MTGPARVIVLGSINVDLVVVGAPLPAFGETVVGGRFERHHGGKGGNQAVATSRALRGVESGGVVMLGAVGDDALGSEALAALRDEGVECSHVAVRRGEATGIALIAVDPEGRNQMTVAPGANATITPGEVVAALSELLASPSTRRSVLLASLEVPLDVVMAAGRVARDAGARFVLNPAPAQDVPADLLRLAHVVTPNEHEVLRLAPGAQDDPEEAARRLAVAHPLITIAVTLGARGVFVTGPEGTGRIPALEVRALDTTGAGDAFNGALAAGLAEGLGLGEAVRRGRSAGALATTLIGAREAMPYREEVDRIELVRRGIDGMEVE